MNPLLVLLATVGLLVAQTQPPVQTPTPATGGTNVTVPGVNPANMNGQAGGAFGGGMSAGAVDGVWSVVYMEMNGQASMRPAGNTVTIRGNQMVFTGLDGRQHILFLQFGPNGMLFASLSNTTGNGTVTTGTGGTGTTGTTGAGNGAIMFPFPQNPGTTGAGTPATGTQQGGVAAQPPFRTGPGTQQGGVAAQPPFRAGPGATNQGGAVNQQGNAGGTATAPNIINGNNNNGVDNNGMNNGFNNGAGFNNQFGNGFPMMGNYIISRQFLAISLHTNGNFMFPAQAGVTGTGQVGTGTNGTGTNGAGTATNPVFPNPNGSNLNPPNLSGMIPPSNQSLIPGNGTTPAPQTPGATNPQNGRPSGGAPFFPNPSVPTAGNGTLGGANPAGNNVAGNPAANAAAAQAQMQAQANAGGNANNLIIQNGGNNNGAVPFTGQLVLILSRGGFRP